MSGHSPWLNRVARKGFGSNFSLESLESRQLLSGSGATIALSSGFAGSAGQIALNGSAKLNGSRLELTDTAAFFEAGSAWATAKQDITSFTTTFSFQLTNANADGFCFVLQAASPNALGTAGGNLGFTNIPTSVALKFDLYNNGGEGSDSTGLYLNGAVPLSANSVDLTGGGIDLHSGHLFTATVAYANGTLSQTITDTVTNATFTRNYAVNVPTILGANTAYVGFTGGTGGLTAVQDITAWTYTPVSAPVAPAAPTGLTATASAGRIALAWVASTGASTYNVYRSLIPGGEGTTPYATGLTTPAFTDNAVAGGTTYYYQVTAVAGSGQSTPSAESSAMATVTLPAAPTGLTATVNSASQITLNWADNSGNETGFRVEQSNNSGNTWNEIGTVGSNVTADPIGGLAASTSYSFRARAYNAAGTSAYTNVATATTNAQATTAINFGSGFAGSAGLIALNGSAKLNGSRLELTDTAAFFEAGSAWATAKQDITSFTTTFSFQLTNANADGFCFVLQAASPNALGTAGGNLGFTNIPTSVALKFDLYNNGGEGSDSTGLYLNGAVPLSANSVDLTGGGIDLHSGHLFTATVAYANGTLSQTITDTVTNATFTRNYAVNIPTILGANTAYVGFTGGTGGLTAVQDITAWTLNNTVIPKDTQAPTAPTGLATVLVNSTIATIQWGASSDNVGVAGYTIYRNGTFAGSVGGATTTFTDNGLNPSTSYSYTVTASDAAGNTSPISSALGVTTASQQTAPPLPLGVGGTWNVAFNENFNTVDPKIWSSRYWWNGNSGTNATFDPSAVSTSNGVLSITATKQSEAAVDGVVHPYTSGLLTTGGIQGVTPASFTFTYGYVECRSKIAPGQGMWSALWMLPADYSDDHEMDIFENLGRLPNNFNGFYHLSGPAAVGGFNTPTATDLTQAFHVYGVDWEPDHISWYLDGVEIYRYSNASLIINKPMYLILNLDVGGSWAGPLDGTSPQQSSWQVDYLRVWQH